MYSERRRQCGPESRTNDGSRKARIVAVAREQPILDARSDLEATKKADGRPDQTGQPENGHGRRWLLKGNLARRFGPGLAPTSARECSFRTASQALLGDDRCRDEHGVRESCTQDATDAMGWTPRTPARSARNSHLDGHCCA